jgi:hypothetical protein
MRGGYTRRIMKAIDQERPELKKNQPLDKRIILPCMRRLAGEIVSHKAT